MKAKILKRIDALFNDIRLLNFEKEVDDMNAFEPQVMKEGPKKSLKRTMKTMVLKLTLNLTMGRLEVNALRKMSIETIEVHTRPHTNESLSLTVMLSRQRFFL